MVKKSGFVASILFFAVIASAQQPFSYSSSLMTGYGGPDQLPFWMRSNQFGSIPPAGFSASLTGSINKQYDNLTRKKIDWSIGAEGRLNLGDPVKFILPEGYGKLRYGIIEIKAGRVKEITGLCDTLLTSGSWSVSGNAPGIPKLEISIPEFVRLPLWDGLFAVKMSYVNGFMGKWYVKDDYVPKTKSWLIQHTFYLRMGKPSWKLNIYGGFNHQVIWGNERQILGEEYKLSVLETFIYANLAKPYDNGSIRQMRVGNHLGSIDAGFTYEFENARLFVYRQFIYDAGALYYLANLRDGLSGISITNKTQAVRNFSWNRILIEFLYTKNQAGETWSPYTASRYENYYNNDNYPAGWCYRGYGIGNPLISSPGTIRHELPGSDFNNFVNNRVIALHGGFDFNLLGWNLLSRLTFSRNYGAYDTAPDGKIYGGENNEALFGIFPVTDQFSGYLRVQHALRNGLMLSLTGALDQGLLYENTFGLMASLSKKF